VRTFRSRIIFLLGLPALLILPSCEDDGTGPSEDRSSLSVFLTDAPGDVEAVWVELLGLTAQGGEGGPMELLAEPTGLVLLTDLVGTVQLLSVSTDLDPTTFNQLRLLIGDAVLQSTEGVVYVKGDPDLPAGLEEAETGQLQCPSCSQTGIKVKVPNDEVELEDEDAALVLDFDVAQSFGHKAGNSGKWVMHPVIHGTLVKDEDGDGSVLDDLGLSRSIAGSVTLASGITIPECPAGTPRSMEDFIPTATLNGILDGDGNAILRTGSVAADGSLAISYLAAGSYTLGFVQTLELDTWQLDFGATVAPTQADLSAENLEGVAYEITSAACNPAG